jgi:hypothetical protein
MTLPLPTIVAVCITAVGGVATTAVTWGVTSNRIETLRAEQAAQDAKLSAQEAEIALSKTHIVVEDTKLDNLKETLGRVEDTVDKLCETGCRK